MKDIAGRTAFITGGAQGIGLGIARRLAREGVNLALVDIDADALKRALDELGGKTKVKIDVLDVRDRDAFARVADAVEAELGPVSLLFNNAGVAGGTSIHKMSYTTWDWVLGVNLQGVVNGIQTFLPRMIQRGIGGHVVNTSSGSGLFAVGSGFLYATSKYAVVGMSEALNFELKQAKTNIGLSVLCPGPVNTGIVGRSLELKPGYVPPTNPATIKEIEFRKATLAAGVDIDEVGDMVLRGIEDDALYIFTDRIIADPIVERTKAILAALPGGAEKATYLERGGSAAPLGSQNAGLMPSFVLEALIPAKPQEVFSVVANPLRSSEWNKGHLGFPKAPPKTITAGASYSQSMESMGSRADVEWQVKRYEVPEIFEIEGHGPMGIRLHITYALAANGSATTLSVTTTLGGGPLTGPLAKIALKKAHEDLQESLGKLKSLFTG